MKWKNMDRMEKMVELNQASVVPFCKQHELDPDILFCMASLHPLSRAVQCSFPIERLMLLQIRDEYVNCNHSAYLSQNWDITEKYAKDKHNVSWWE
jgi:hypothetical protein